MTGFWRWYTRVSTCHDVELGTFTFPFVHENEIELFEAKRRILPGFHLPFALSTHGRRFSADPSSPSPDLTNRATRLALRSFRRCRSLPRCPPGRPSTPRARRSR